MLAEAQEARQILDEEQLVFLANPGIPAGQAQTIIPHNAAFQTEVPNSVTYLNNIDNQSVHALQDFEHSSVMDFTSNEKIKELDNIICKASQSAQTVHMLTKPQVFYDNTHKQALVEVPCELPKVSLLNASLKKPKFHLAQFDSVVKKRTTPSALEKGEWGKMIELLQKRSWSQDVLFTVMNSMSLNNDSNQIQDKVFVITSLKNDLRKSKGKEIVENVVHIPSATTIAPGMFKLNLEPFPPRLLQNREVHIDYLRNTQEQANILREIVEQVKAKQPFDDELDLTCKYITRIQELLVYVQDTCPNAITPSTKKVVVTPTEQWQERVKCSTSDYGSKPLGNKKNDRISQKPSRNKKNKVETQPRKVNKFNRVVKPVCDVDVKHSLSNANSDILCATCNKSMFDGVHDKCLLDLVQNGNNRSKSSKKHKKQNI
ncbi:hypothetical protein Tco_0919788 [Tanacetum coccineum]